jgi:hypothetical protein
VPHQPLLDQRLDRGLVPHLDRLDPRGRCKPVRVVPDLDPCGSCDSARWQTVRGAACVVVVGGGAGGTHGPSGARRRTPTRCSDALQDSARVTGEESSDFRAAVAAARMLADETPELVACRGDGASATSPAELKRRHPAPPAHVVDQVEQSTGSERVDDVLRAGRRRHCGSTASGRGGQRRWGPERSSCRIEARSWCCESRVSA